MDPTASKPAKRLAGAPRCALAAAIAAATAGSALAAEAEPGCGPDHPHVTMVVDGVRNAKGQLTAEIYPDIPARFLAKDANLIRVRVPAARPEVSICLPIAGPGVYAAVVYHDEDADGRFDRNALGLPTEGFGISNNPAIALSRPTVQQARFTAGEGETVIHIHMRYLLGGHMP